MPNRPSTCEMGVEEKKISLVQREVEQRIAATKAISNAETENLLSRLRLVRSYFTSEQLQMPALQFFEENLPSLLAVRNDKYQIYELQWKGGDALNSFENCGLEFSTQSVKEHLVKAMNLQIPNFSCGELLENQYQELRDSLQTPGVSRDRLSIGTTPKSLRVPKHGELLMSVYGSPLGLYKEENLEVINESEDCNTTNSQ